MKDEYYVYPDPGHIVDEDLPTARVVNNEGMTLRQHYAGLAMQGLLPVADKSEKHWGQRVAEGSVNMADFLIKELEKEQPILYKVREMTGMSYGKLTQGTEMAAQMNGLQFKMGKKNVRIWKYGFEVGDNLGGRVYWFPWCKHFWR